VSAGGCERRNEWNLASIFEPLLLFSLRGLFSGSLCLCYLAFVEASKELSAASEMEDKEI